MRLMFAGFVVSSLLAACGGGGGGATLAPGSNRPGATIAGQPTAAGQPTTAAQPTAGSAPQPGSGTVAVSVTGGEHAGTYTGGDNPNCSYSLFSPDTWGVQYSTTGAQPDQFSSLQLVYRPSGGGDDGDMFSGVGLLMTVSFGDLLDSANYTSYEVEVRVDGEDSSGTGSATVNDTGSTAVIHATGTTPDGVSLDATVNCPSVMRG